MKINFYIYKNDKLEIKLGEKNEFPYLFLSISNKSEEERNLIIQVEIKIGENLVTADNVGINAQIERTTIVCLSHLDIVKSNTLRDLHFSVFIKGLGDFHEEEDIYRKQFVVPGGLACNSLDLI